jgi:hypothetical protein
VTRPLIYVAHPFGGDQSRLNKAESWVAFLCQRFDALFWAPWIPLCRHWPDTGDSRKRGLELDLEAVRRSDGIILVGGEVSPGMLIERDAADECWDWHEFTNHRIVEWIDNTPETEAFSGWIRELQLGRAGS